MLTTTSNGRLLLDKEHRDPVAKDNEGARL